MRNRSMRRALAVLATAAGLFVSLMSSPAHAYTGEQIDEIAVDGGKSDFGDDPHLFGAPFGKGKVSYELVRVNGTLLLHARVSGQTYQDDEAGHCVRTVIRFEKADGTLLKTRFSPTLCSPHGGLHSTGVWARNFQHAELAQVRIFTQLQGSNTTYATTGSATSVYN